MDSDYREFPAPPALARHLVCVWVQTIGDAPHGQRVLPDACADIVFVGEAAPVIAGPATQPVTVALPAGATVIGVRFRPGVAPTMLRAPADALRDREVALRDVWGPAADALWEQVATRTSAAERLAAVLRALAARRGGAEADPLVDAGVAWLARHPAHRLGALTRALDVGERQLRRRFDAAVGYGPKTLQRILRLQALLRRARQAPGAGLAALAADLGYADQAHMTREVRALSGMAPRQLLRDADTTLALSDLFNHADEEAA